MDRLRKILSPAINTEKRDSKKRKVFRDSKGRTYVIQGDKKVYVKKLFTPTRNSSPVKNTPAKSPVINTGKVNAKKRRVFKDSKGRTYVKQGDKKVYVKKLFTPMRNSSPIKKYAYESGDKHRKCRLSETQNIQRLERFVCYAEWQKSVWCEGYVHSPEDCITREKS